MNKTIYTEPKKKSRIAFHLAAAFFITASGLTSGCGGDEEPVATAVKIRPVRYAEVFATGSDRSRVFAGTAQSASAQRLSFRVSGTLMGVFVDVGTRVVEGQALARIDSSEYSLQRQQFEAGLAQAGAEARNAKASYERVVSLYENKTTSLSELDAARATFESASASVRSAETALSLAEKNVGYTQLVAPVNGVVAEVSVETNERVSAGEVIVVVDRAGRPEVEVAVPESFIGRIQPRQRVQVIFGAVTGSSFSATVTEVGTATTGGGTFTVTVRLDENSDAVRPGMAAEVTFTIPGSSGGNSRVLVPAQAVGEDQNGQFVFVLKTESGGFAVAERRTVQVGALTAEGIELLVGVSDGEFVATAGLHSISPGQRVRLLGF